MRTKPVYQNVFHVVGLIPKGRVASYGQIAAMLDGCTARMVGYAMSAIPEGFDLPWQRVVNSQGKVSRREDREGMTCQRRMLEAEGVRFRKSGTIDMKKFRWDGPGAGWLVESGMGPIVGESGEI